jgi:tetratricopeptide (TPR) repeat protein
MVVHNDSAKATDLFESALKENPRRGISALDRVLRRYFSPAGIAELISLFGAEAEAIEYYEARVAQRPTADRLWLIATLRQQPPVADYEAALSACEQGREQFEEARNWDLLAARVHARFRRFDRALAVLERIKDSKTPEFWEIAAWCHLRRGEWKKTEQATRRYLAVEGIDLASELRKLTVKEWRYEALEQQGRTSETAALRHEMERGYRRLYERFPNDAIEANNLAWFLATHDGDLDEAFRLAQGSVDRMPAAFNLDTLAWIQHLRGDTAAAWKTMKRALDQQDDLSPEYHYHAGAILLALDRREEARDYLERAVGAGIDFDEFDDAQRLLESLGGEVAPLSERAP